jgi:hypothetical protein
MPNNQESAKARIDKDAKQAIADLKKVTDKHPELNLELRPVKDSLEKIASDTHRAR